MSNVKYGLVTAAKEHLISGNPMTRLDAMVLFGVPDLPKVISEMRRDGWVIESRHVPYVMAVKRINKNAVLEPPKNLPIRDINLTEYWVNK